MDRKKIAIALGAMCMILTYGIVVQIKTVNGIGSTFSTNSRENELRDAVLKSKEKYDELYQELEKKEEQLEKERNKSTKNNTELSELEETIKIRNKTLGLTEVKGEGMIIIVNDNQKIQLSTWGADPNMLIVHDLDLINIVNELKNAGAEAISINGQRIVANTSIECDGNVIKINGEKVAAPFEIKAIGFPALLMGLNRFGGYIDYLEEERFLDISVKTYEKEEIVIPKYTGVMKFEYAKSR